MFKTYTFKHIQAAEAEEARLRAEAQAKEAEEKAHQAELLRQQLEDAKLQIKQQAEVSKVASRAVNKSV